LMCSDFKIVNRNRCLAKAHWDNDKQLCHYGENIQVGGEQFLGITICIVFFICAPFLFSILPLSVFALLILEVWNVLYISFHHQFSYK
jgi:hypothetical protein